MWKRKPAGGVERLIYDCFEHGRRRNMDGWETDAKRVAGIRRRCTQERLGRVVEWVREELGGAGSIALQHAMEIANGRGADGRRPWPQLGPLQVKRALAAAGIEATGQGMPPLQPAVADAMRTWLGKCSRDPDQETPLRGAIRHMVGQTKNVFDDDGWIGARPPSSAIMARFLRIAGFTVKRNSAGVSTVYGLKLPRKAV